MEDNPAFVKVKVGALKTEIINHKKPCSFALIKIKLVAIYNRINNYILDAFLKVVFTHDDA
ncbi:hypothetical protein [Ligilactobacillus acidipiscis]|uniref:hypothetical protein n=1 Tax=Ligilactobacillus acidipiscis TaxID=89059 RepID=UPI0022E7EED7|nr:hypothetical protein [Ligilactobacillus acidipiscis]